jgi:hypothetical protein
MRRLVPLLLLAIAWPNPASAQAPQTPPCTGPEYRTLDFWVGDWIAEDQQGHRIGTNHVTRNEYGDCIISEHFKLDDGRLTGHSVSTYRPGLKQWRQNWVDNQNGYFDLVGGPVTGQDYTFYFENKRLSDAQPYQRMIWQDVKSDSLIWRWQHRAKPADAWVDDWVINYRRNVTASTK